MFIENEDQKDTLIYNSKILIEHIPLKAYEYVVNGKSAIEWIMERYQMTTHKESGITNNPNDWSKDVGNPRYILDLLLVIINVSMKTVKIVESLPGVRFWEEEKAMIVFEAFSHAFFLMFITFCWYIRILVWFYYYCKILQGQVNCWLELTNTI